MKTTPALIKYAHENPDVKRAVDLHIEMDSNVRWENGMDHHPMSKRLMNFLSHYDFAFQEDAFCWKIGGDGDNGELLMYELDVFFEILDKSNENK